MRNNESSKKSSETPSDEPVPTTSDTSFSPALRPFFAVADGMAALFQPFVEVVVHDLHTDSVAYVVRPFSPREVGDPSDLRGAILPPDTRVVGPYDKINWDGRRIKSISIVLRDTTDTPIGLLCMNADLTEFDAARRMLQGFLGLGDAASPAATLFQDDWHEKVNRFVAAWTSERRTTVDRLDRTARRALIEDLHATGGFEGRRAPAYVATILGISRATVYNELARLKSGVPA